MQKGKNTEAIVSWVLAMLICPFGVCITAKSQLGVSMIEAPVYVLFLKLSEIWDWFTFGTSEYVVQAVVLLLLCVATRRFRWRYLLSFATAVIFGWILDGWNFLFSWLSAETVLMQVVFAAIGCVTVSFAVAMFFRTWLPLEVWELFVKEFAERYDLNMTKVKWVYDLSSLAVGVLLMLVLFGGFRWDAIGIGTIVTTFINAPLIGLCTKLLDRIWKKNKNG